MDQLKPNNNTENNKTGSAGQTPSAMDASPQHTVRVKRVVKRPERNQGSIYSWLLLPAIFLMGLGSGWLIWGRDAAPTNTADTQVQAGDAIKRYEVSVDDDPASGPESAPITIVEFSDYQCPFCIKWHDEVFARLMKDYEGKIRFVYRDFPLESIHPEALPAAEAANCAGEQGYYWQYHEALFGQKNGLGSKAYMAYATELGLDVDKFTACMNSENVADEIKADIEYASSIGVSSTPTFFVNGMAVIGAQPYEVFKELIDKELAGELPK